MRYAGAGRYPRRPKAVGQELAAVSESYEEGFGDSDLWGPATTLSIATHMEKHGGSPKRWFLERCRTLDVSQHDRDFLEVGTLVEAL